MRFELRYETQTAREEQVAEMERPACCPASPRQDSQIVMKHSIWIRKFDAIMKSPVRDAKQYPSD
jgi:hypothetical protein